MENKEFIKSLFDDLYLRQRNMTAGQLNFIDSCKKYFTKNSTLSPAQIKILKELKQFLPSEQQRTTNKPILVQLGLE